MNAFVLLLCILNHCYDTPSDTSFKYVSSQDTVIVLESDIVHITVDSNDYWTFQLNEQMFNAFSGIQDQMGCLFYFCKKNNRWIPIPIMKWHDQAIPSGWYVQANKSGSIVSENQTLCLRVDRIYNKKRCLCVNMLSKKRKKQVRRISRYH